MKSSTLMARIGCIVIRLLISGYGISIFVPCSVEDLEIASTSPNKA